MKTVVENTKEFWQEWYTSPSIIMKQYIEDKMYAPIFYTDDNISIDIDIEGFTFSEITKIFEVIRGLCAELNSLQPYVKFEERNRFKCNSILEIKIVEE